MMVLECASQQEKEAFIKAVASADFSKITKRRFFFDWKALEEDCKLYKLVLAETGEILGLMCLLEHPGEQRTEVKLLAVSHENKGRNKQFDGIAGCLLSFACREAIRQYAEMACVSLRPKTNIRQHYIQKYGMSAAGTHVYVEDMALQSLMQKYPL